MLCLKILANMCLSNVGNGAVFENADRKHEYVIYFRLSEKAILLCRCQL